MNDLMKVCRALSDPTRVKILTQLSAGALCVGALAERVGITHSAVSQHLRVLRDVGLVEGDKRGYWVHYSLDRKRVREISTQVGKWLEGLASRPLDRCVANARCPRKRRSERN